MSLRSKTKEKMSKLGLIFQPFLVPCHKVHLCYSTINQRRQITLRNIPNESTVIVLMLNVNSNQDLGNLPPLSFLRYSKSFMSSPQRFLIDGHTTASAPRSHVLYTIQTTFANGETQRVSRRYSEACNNFFFFFSFNLLLFL